MLPASLEASFKITNYVGARRAGARYDLLHAVAGFEANCKRGGKVAVRNLR